MAGLIKTLYIQAESVTAPGSIEVADSAHAAFVCVIMKCLVSSVPTLRRPITHANCARHFHRFGQEADADAFNPVMIEGLFFTIDDGCAGELYPMKAREVVRRGLPPPQRLGHSLRETNRSAGEFHSRSLASALRQAPGRQFVTDREADQRAADCSKR